MTNKRQVAICNMCDCGSHAWQPLSRWAVVLVDAEDSWALSNHVWTLMNGNRFSSYAHARGYVKISSSGSYLHRAIMQTSSVVKIDHINGNGLDCRKNNLRQATQRQNLHNRRPKRSGTSKYLGVHRISRGAIPKFQTQIAINKKTVLSLTFASEQDAAICYNYHAAHYHGDFVRFNQITEYMHD